VLSTRLTKFEEAGIVERRIPPAPQRGVVYGLTEAGAKLKSVGLASARWEPGQLGAQQPGEIVPASTLGIDTQGHV
jgi:DNA-binding HxlR family transcriptional regulator